MKITPIILAGGKGTRLWPESRTATPKQFLKLTNNFSLLQNTILRLNDFDFNDPIVICNNEDKFTIKEQLDSINKNATLILETVGKNTAPAIAIATLHPECANSAMLVLPADHEISDISNLKRSIKYGVDLVKEGYLVTFGIKPLSPHTGYGYIEKGLNVKNGFHIKSFKEKPNNAVAEDYLKSKAYLWNSGMFLMESALYLEELKKYSPEIYNVCNNQKLINNISSDEYLIDEEIFTECPSNSIDYAIMEKTDKGAMVELDAGWSDIGSWRSLWEFLEKDKNGNVLIGDNIVSDVSNSYIKSDERLITSVGLDGVIIVDTKDSILVASNEKSEDVKNILAVLNKKDRIEKDFHREVHRPWGKYDSIDNGESFQVKRITVKPKQKLSVQMHYHRAEHWVVVQGIGRVHYGDEYKDLKVNESTYHDKEVIHALENPGDEPLILIEVQVGDYLGEDDIVRYEDIYGRS